MRTKISFPFLFYTCPWFLWSKLWLFEKITFKILNQLASVLYWFPTENLDRSWTIGQTGRILFYAEDYTNMSYYNCCGIRPKHSNISKRGGGYYNLCGIIVLWIERNCYPDADQCVLVQCISTNWMANLCI
jgi:hypothetical protein